MKKFIYLFCILFATTIVACDSGNQERGLSEYELTDETNPESGFDEDVNETPGTDIEDTVVIGEETSEQGFGRTEKYRKTEALEKEYIRE